MQSVKQAPSRGQRAKGTGSTYRLREGVDTNAKTWRRSHGDTVHACAELGIIQQGLFSCVEIWCSPMLCIVQPYTDHRVLDYAQLNRVSHHVPLGSCATTIYCLS